MTDHAKHEDEAGPDGAAEARPEGEGGAVAEARPRHRVGERLEGEGADDAGPARSRRRALWVVAAIVVVAAVVAGLLWWNQPEEQLDTVTLHSVEYTTNLRMDEHNGYAYVYVPVNTDAGEAVLEVEDEADSAEIRAFLDGLDTLVPGEHVLELSDANLHFIVDGMEE